MFLFLLVFFSAPDAWKSISKMTYNYSVKKEIVLVDLLLQR